MTAILAAIYISPSASTLPHSVQSVRALAGRGLEGDRYALVSGTFSANSGQRDVTLVEAEALDQFVRDYSHPFDAAQSRRNLADTWWQHIEHLRLKDKYGLFMAKPPELQPWGLRVLYLTDPTGVLWHIADRPKS